MILKIKYLKMIKALIVLSLVALTVSQKCPNTTFEVNVFRGQLILLQGKLKFEDITSRGIIVSDYNLSTVAENTPNSWDEVCVSEGVNCFIPLRRTHQWEHTYVNGLGVYLQADFEDDEENKFTITLSLGQCSNDYTVEDMIVCKDFVEQKRQENSAELAHLFSTLKEAASEHISASNTIDDLTDDHVDKKKKLADLEALNQQLAATLVDLNKEISENEKVLNNHEKMTGEACASCAIANADIFRLDKKIKAFETRVSVYELQKSSSSAFTDEDRENYDKAYSEVIEKMMSLGSFNKKLQAVTIEKNKQIDPEDFRSYFH